MNTQSEVFPNDVTSITPVHHQTTHCFSEVRGWGQLCNNGRRSLYHVGPQTEWQTVTWAAALIATG